MARKKNVKRHAVLRIEGPEGRTWSADLLGERYVVGRGDPGGETRVDFEVPEDAFLSRAHLALERGDGFYAVRNLSANGTVVSGKVIEAPVRLRDKDRIEAGAGTTLTYLLLKDEERNKVLSAGPAQEATAERRVPAAPRRPLWKRPVFVGMLVFYGLLAVLVVGARGRKASDLAHPGSGPYLGWVLERPVVTSRPKGDARAMADAMWRAALARHGGDLLAEGGHAFLLLLEAREVAGVLGYETLAEALAKGETFAQRAKLALDDLETRVATLFGEADQYASGRHWDLAKTAYARLVEAVPDNRTTLRQYAVARIKSMRQKRGQ